MKMFKGMTIVLSGLMAVGAMAETNPASTPSRATASSTTTAKRKKIVRKKSLSRAKQDRVTMPQSSSVSAATATTSMPSLTAGTSSAVAPKEVVVKKKKWTDGIRAGILFEYYGNSLTDPFSGQQTDKDTGYAQSGTPQELDTRLTLGYALTDNLTLTYNAYFWSLADSEDGPGTRFGFRPADSFLRLNVGKIVQSGRFKWNGDFRYYPGFKDSEKGYAGRDFYFRSGQNISYAVTPRLNLASYNQVRYYHNDASGFYNTDGTAKKDGQVVDLILIYGPAIEYQAFDQLGLSLSFNGAYAHTYVNGTWADAAEYKGNVWGKYFEFGLNIDATKAINVFPYVDMYTHTFNAEAFQLGANVNITIL